MQDWATRIEMANVDQRVQLHLARWQQWNTFIASLEPNSEPERIIQTVADDDQEREFKNKLQAQEGPWSVWHIEKDGVPYITFDASFGSLNSTSDLDINVISSDTSVLEKWKDFVAQHTVNEQPASFSVYWDSNFYFEPAEIVEGKLKSIKEELLDNHFQWTTPATAKTEFEAVKSYADAYWHNRMLPIDTYRVKPNPEGLTLRQELQYYEATIHFANAFKNDHSILNYLKFASCKIEGLVSIPALAICNVFGSDVYGDFIYKRNRAEYLHANPIGTAIAVYELVRNLEIHAHKHEGHLEFKSKYANRLLNILANDINICEKCKQDLRSKKHGHQNALEKTNAATFSDLHLAMRFLRDYMDGISEYAFGRCQFIEDPRLADITQAKEQLEIYIRSNLVHIRQPDLMTIKLRL